MHSSAPTDWVRMYRQGVSCSAIAVLSQDDVTDIVNAVGTAQRADASLEHEHTANMLRYARQVQAEVARDDALPPSWKARLQELKVFVQVHGSMPKSGALDAAESSLARWLHEQRSKAALDPGQRSALDAVGDWNPGPMVHGNVLGVQSKLRSLIGFRRTQGRWPTPVNSGDQHECTLGKWLITLRQAANDGRLPEDLRRNLDRAVPDWNP